jgi:hypothetical protein
MTIKTDCPAQPNAKRPARGGPFRILVAGTGFHLNLLTSRVLNAVKSSETLEDGIGLFRGPA